MRSARSPRGGAAHTPGKRGRWGIFWAARGPQGRTLARPTARRSRWCDGNGADRPFLNSITQRGGNLGHVVMSVRDLKGYVGGPIPQPELQRVRQATSMCCSVCSTADSIFAVHKPSTMYGKESRERDCLEKHQADPSAGKRRHPHGKSGKRAERDDDEWEDS